jgi:uncharacterized membrane protein
MSLIGLFFQRPTRLLTLTLGGASIAAVALVAARILHARQLQYGFLVWNLLLAWLPFLLAVAFQARVQAAGRCDWKSAGLAAAWLLFLPNAPYIFTDLVHLRHGVPGLFWVDLMLVLIVALIGLALGLGSVRIMHVLMARWLGGATGWVFVAAVAGLAALGVHLGRFVRLNSWDAAVAPLTVSREAGASVLAMVANPQQAVFPLLFAFFFFLSYATVHALSVMPAVQSLPPDAASRRTLES